MLVVDKPAGVVVHPAPGHRAGTLVQALAGRVAGGDDPERPGVVHRLDRDTSGLLVMARDDAAHAALKAQLQARTIVREYLALVEGRPPARRGTIDAPLGRDRRVRTRVSTETDEPRTGDHALRGRGGARRRHPPPRPARDRPHPPDPRAPARHRPPGGRRPGVRRPRPPRPGAPVPPRDPARVRASGVGRTGRGELPAARRPDPRASGCAREKRAGPPEVGEGRAGPHRLGTHRFS